MKNAALAGGSDGVSDGTSDGINSGMVAEKQQVLQSEIERLMKDFKVHRCALTVTEALLTLNGSV